MVGKKVKRSDGKKSKGSGGLEEIAGYKILPVRFASSTEDEDEDEDGEDGSLHYLYFKQHKGGKDGDLLMPTSRTIYMYNLPADTTERDIRRLLQGVARVARVIFHGVVGHDAVKSNAETSRMTSELASAMSDAAVMQAKKSKKNKKQPKGGDKDDETKPVPRTRLLRAGSSAHIVLLEDDEMNKVLTMKADAVREWPSRDADDIKSPLEYRGLSRYIYEHRAMKPPIDLLKSEVDAYMAKFEEAQYERERMLSQQQNVPDADGFVTVIRRGRNTKNKDGSASVTAASVEEAREAGQKKKLTTFGNMYRFQLRESKNEQLLELRKKFEEDKEKLSRMRQSRLFRPY